MTIYYVTQDGELIGASFSGGEMSGLVQTKMAEDIRSSAAEYELDLDDPSDIMQAAFAAGYEGDPAELDSFELDEEDETIFKDPSSMELDIMSVIEDTDSEYDIDIFTQEYLESMVSSPSGMGLFTVRTLLEKVREWANRDDEEEYEDYSDDFDEDVAIGDDFGEEDESYLASDTYYFSYDD